MAVPQISAKLSDLYELLKSSRDTQAAEEAKNVIVDLGHVLLRPLSDTEQGESLKHSILMLYNVVQRHAQAY